MKSFLDLFQRPAVRWGAALAVVTLVLGVVATFLEWGLVAQLCFGLLGAAAASLTIIAVGGWLIRRERARRQALFEEQLAQREGVTERRNEWASWTEELDREGIDRYALPFYLLVGEPQSGKSVLLQNSGLSFPFGQSKLSGVAGTRGCDWWFAQEAVILDIAGRLFTQDATSSDSAEWTEFLQLLQTYKPLAPAEGVLLVIPCDSLLTDGLDAAAAKAERMRNSLISLVDELGVKLPVYLVLTKADRIFGFAETVHRLDSRRREQMFGWSRGAANYAAPLKKEEAQHGFQELVRRAQALRSHAVVTATLPEAQGEVDRLHAFPDELSQLEEPLLAYVERILTTSPLDERLYFRGIYLTSGLQTGVPIAKLCRESFQELGEDDTRQLEAIFEKQRAFFIKDLARKRIFSERGLVEPSPARVKEAKRKRAIGFAGCAAALVLSATFAGSYLLDGARKGTFDTLEGVVLALDASPGRFDALEPEQHFLAAYRDASSLRSVATSLRADRTAAERINTPPALRQADATLLDAYGAWVKPALAELLHQHLIDEVSRWNQAVESDDDAHVEDLARLSAVAHTLDQGAPWTDPDFYEADPLLLQEIRTRLGRTTVDVDDFEAFLGELISDRNAAEQVLASLERPASAELIDQLSKAWRNVLDRSDRIDGLIERDVIDQALACGSLRESVEALAYRQPELSGVPTWRVYRDRYLKVDSLKGTHGTPDPKSLGRAYDELQQLSVGYRELFANRARSREVREPNPFESLDDVLEEAEVVGAQGAPGIAAAASDLKSAGRSLVTFADFALKSSAQYEPRGDAPPMRMRDAAELLQNTAFYELCNVSPDLDRNPDRAADAVDALVAASAETWSPPLLGKAARGLAAMTLERWGQQFGDLPQNYDWDASTADSGDEGPDVRIVQALSQVLNDGVSGVDSSVMAWRDTLARRQREEVERDAESILEAVAAQGFGALTETDAGRLATLAQNAATGGGGGDAQTVEATILEELGRVFNALEARAASMADAKVVQRDGLDRRDLLELGLEYLENAAGVEYLRQYADALATQELAQAIDGRQQRAAELVGDLCEFSVPKAPAIATHDFLDPGVRELDRFDRLASIGQLKDESDEFTALRVAASKLLAAWDREHRGSWKDDLETWTPAEWIATVQQYVQLHLAGRGFVDPTDESPLDWDVDFETRWYRPVRDQLTDRIGTPDLLESLANLSGGLGGMPAVSAVGDVMQRAAATEYAAGGRFNSRSQLREHLLELRQLELSESDGPAAQIESQVLADFRELSEQILIAGFEERLLEEVRLLTREEPDFRELIQYLDSDMHEDDRDCPQGFWIFEFFKPRWKKSARSTTFGDVRAGYGVELGEAGDTLTWTLSDGEEPEVEVLELRSIEKGARDALLDLFRIAAWIRPVEDDAEPILVELEIPASARGSDAWQLGYFLWVIDGDQRDLSNTVTSRFTFFDEDLLPAFALAANTPERVGSKTYLAVDERLQLIWSNSGVGGDTARRGTKTMQLTLRGALAPLHAAWSYASNEDTRKDGASDFVVSTQIPLDGSAVDVDWRFNRPVPRKPSLAALLSDD